MNIDLAQWARNATSASGWLCDLLITIGASAAIVALGALLFGVVIAPETIFAGIPAGVTGALVWRRVRRDNR